MRTPSLRRLLIIGICVGVVTLPIALNRVGALGKGSHADAYSEASANVGAAIEAPGPATPVPSPTSFPRANSHPVLPALPLAGPTDKSAARHPKLASPLARLADAAPQALPQENGPPFPRLLPFPLI